MSPPDQELAWLGAVGRALAPLNRVAVHDVRSPLNALRLNLTLVRRTLEKGGAERWLGVAEEEVSRLEACFNSSLSLFMPFIDAAPDADLSAAFRASEAVLGSSAEKRGVEWRASVPALPGPWPSGASAAGLATASLFLSHSERGDSLTVTAERIGSAGRVAVEGRGRGVVDGASASMDDIERLWRRRDPLGEVAWSDGPRSSAGALDAPDSIRVTIMVGPANADHTGVAGSA